jgi:NAD-dependent SIR2 family protein deacetylase
MGVPQASLVESHCHHLRILICIRRRPTPAHYFMRLLHEKGLLLRVFTQNIDSLEKQAGLPAEAIVAAHGNFDSEALCLVV